MMMAESGDVVDDPNYENSHVSCSICLDFVADYNRRSIAKLQCGHEFHLDCIGSAFNMKGAMQCPNCRKIEGGRWLYANGSARSMSDFGIDDRTISEDPYELYYTETPFGVHWCPFSGLTRVHSSSEEVETPSTTYHRNSQSWQNEIYNPSTFPAPNVQYQARGHNSPPISNWNHFIGVDQASVPPALRFSRVEVDALSRSGPFVHPFLYGHGGRSSIVTSTNQPVSNTRPHEGVQVSHIGHHTQGNPASLLSPVMPGVRRFIGPRGLPLTIPVLPHVDHHGGFYICPPPGPSAQDRHEAENPIQWERGQLSHFPIISSGRNSGWGSLRHPSGGIASIHMSGNFWRQSL